MSIKYDASFLTSKIQANIKQKAQLSAQLDKLKSDLEKYSALSASMAGLMGNLEDANKSSNMGRNSLQRGYSGQASKSIARQIDIVIEDIKNMNIELVQAQKQIKTKMQDIEEKIREIKQKIKELNNNINYLNAELNKPTQSKRNN